MPTIGGPDYPTTPNAIRVEYKTTWAESFVEAPELEALELNLASAGHGQSKCDVLRRYGIIKQPYETALATVIPLDLNESWIRVLFFDGDVDRVQWMGRIQSQVTQVGGNAVNGVGATNWPVGRQVWSAYGGLEYLEKIGIYESWWAVPYAGGSPVEKKLDWIPSINQRDRLNTIIGNRSTDLYTGPSAEFDSSYVYGGTGVWTYRQYIDYILARFVNSLEGPRFELDGQLSFLDDLESSVKFDRSVFRGLQRGALNIGSTTTAAQILRTLINPQFGLDFVVVPNFSGGSNPDYHIRVFALSGENTEFEGVELPQNDDYVDLDPTAGDTTKLISNPEIIESAEHQYNKIVILGERIVVCTTLRADEEDEDNSQTLVKKWTDELESEYKNPTESVGGTTADDYDAYRRDEKFEAVYQVFGAPVDWNLHSGAAAPDISAAGVPSAPADVASAQFQNMVRDTLPWLPLRKGSNYTVSPVTSSVPTDFEADYRPPVVLLYDETLGKYMNVEHYQISVHCVRNDWGIFINPNPNHRMALLNFDGANDSNAVPEFDWEKLIATIAFQTDKRFQISHTLDDSGKLSIKTIEVPDAELWYAVPGTIVQLSPTGQPEEIHPDNCILRNDSERLYAVMAGAIARYYAERRRCRVAAFEIMAWADVLGKMLENYTSTSGGSTDTVEIMAPITAIEWSNTSSPRQTRILAGLTL